MSLEIEINRIFEDLNTKKEDINKNYVRSVFDEFIALLDKGELRVVEKKGQDWSLNDWVKKGILIGFKIGVNIDYSKDDQSFFDKDTYPTKYIKKEKNIRIVPGGTSIRKGAYISENVIVMPPSYINVGSYVGKGTMIDSIVLVGSCAYIGENCHISAGVKIGGVLEPISARPCIVEDNAFIGINSCIAEGTLVRQHAVIATGVSITSSTTIYDLVKGTKIDSKEKGYIEVPPYSVVVNGTRRVENEDIKDNAEKYGISQYAPIIIKYRDNNTNSKLLLEGVLRK